jgi:hypothetical protein
MHSYGCQPVTQAQANNVTSMPAVIAAAGGGQLAAQQQQQLLLQQQQQQQQQQPLSKFDSHPYDGPINFRALFWVDRGPTIWALQTAIAVICLSEAVLMQYLTYKVSGQRRLVVASTAIRLAGRHRDSTNALAATS